jgi:CheY-like chemotaxis protein
VDSQNILIVEDEMVTALDLQNQIRKLGYGITALARSGEEAIQFTRHSHPDLVLMDLHLTGPMTGLEASRRIREVNEEVPVVYLTAYPSILMRSPGQMQKPYMCLSKPVSIPDLRTIIEIALRT